MLKEVYEDPVLPKVLIVDDDPVMVAILGNMLGDDFKRVATTSGRKALKILEKNDELPDLILLDLIMKEVDGYEVAAFIRADQRLKDIPIVIISGLTDGKSIEKALEAGCTDYIRKPFEKKEVQARILKHISDYHQKIEIQKSNFDLESLIEKKAKEISDSQMATIFALAKLTESRDDDTGVHIVRVQEFCRLLLEKLMGTEKYKEVINHKYIDVVQKASVLHDIGKVAIEDRILLKPGKLTQEEFEKMKTHTTIGSETLREVYVEYPGNAFIEIGVEIARHHHERWDGDGYPDKLAETKIPLSARVVAIADMYDALRSKRVYKPHYSHDETCQIIKEDGGSHLDPFMVDVFLKHNAEFEALYNKITAEKG